VINNKLGEFASGLYIEYLFRYGVGCLAYRDAFFRRENYGGDLHYYQYLVTMVKTDTEVFLEPIQCSLINQPLLHSKLEHNKRSLESTED